MPRTPGYLEAASCRRGLFLGCHYTERLIEAAGKRCCQRTAWVLKDFAIVVPSVTAIQEAWNDPRLCAVARSGQLNGVFEGRLGTTDRVLIYRVPTLIQDGEILAIPLHRSWKLRRVARRNRHELAAAGGEF